MGYKYDWKLLRYVKVGDGAGLKYHNKPVMAGGKKIFDSRLESRYADQLDLMIRAKVIVGYKRQKEFILYGKNGHRVCRHRVDFLVEYPDGHQQAVEVKGFPTAEWRIKRELFKDNYPELNYLVVWAKDIG